MKKILSYAFLGLLLSVSLIGCGANKEKRVVVASKNFTEQVILGELVAQEIEAKTDIKVERRLNLGGTFICHQGIIAGEIDIYPEYTGTAFTAILKLPPITNPRQVSETVKQQYARQFQLKWSEPLGFNNTFAIIIRGQDARQFNITTLSQVGKYTPKWRAGFGYEFIDRADGLPGLAKTYGLTFAEAPKSMDLGLLYRAIAEKQVDLVAGNSTDGVIPTLDLVILKDDKQYFPPYEAAIVTRAEAIAKYPELDRVFHTLAGKITEQDMQRLNYLVDGEKKDPKQVVSEFRRSKNF
ncbi:glycine betaine ABC transporter substrate-binding protein [Tumidithrix helvetica PCC 7403]|uniref:glycine betaine ABC transporter substrate-binding protein n=1 Tax=Tumidithrix helvetica TaxID=3457545 RepID=UPI003C846159